MAPVTVEEARPKLTELIDALRPGEELILTRDARPVAKLVKESPSPMQPRQPGLLKDQIIEMAPDFDAPLEDFRA